MDTTPPTTPKPDTADRSTVETPLQGVWRHANGSDTPPPGPRPAVATHISHTPTDADTARRAAEAEHTANALRHELAQIRTTVAGFLAEAVADTRIDREDANRLLRNIEAPPLVASYTVRFPATLTITMDAEDDSDAAHLAAKHLNQFFDTADAGVDAEVGDVLAVTENDPDAT